MTALLQQPVICIPCSKSEKGSYTNALLRKQPNLLISQSANILRILLQNGRQKKKGIGKRETRPETKTNERRRKRDGAQNT
jgi:hypothetical protein